MDTLLNILQALMDGTMGAGAAQTVLNNVMIMSNLPETVTNSMKSVQNSVIIPIAGVFICIYFIMDLMDKLTTSGVTAEILTKSLIKLIIATSFAAHSYDIMMALFHFGDGLASGMFAAMNATDVSVVPNISVLQDKGFMACLMYFIVFLFPGIISFIANALIMMFCWSRMIELFIRAYFAPIGFSSMVNGNVSTSPGMRYLRKELALVAQGGIMVACALISALLYPKIMGGIDPDFNFADVGATIAIAFKSLAYQGTILMMIVGSKNLATEVIG